MRGRHQSPQVATVAEMIPTRTIPTKTLRNGFQMPVFGLGTWQMGGRRTRDETNDDARDVAAIRAAVDAGVTHIDTAEMYAAGHCETLIGQALQGYERSSLFLVSKASPDSIRAGSIEQAAEESLRRLQTDYLDLYLLHTRVPEADLEKSMAQLDNLVDNVIVRHIGVSNFSADSLALAQSMTSNPVVCNQVHYNLLCREPESTGLLKYCQDNSVLLSAWRPLQYGEFLNTSIPIMAELVEKYDASPAQIAINWLIAQENVITIVKTSDVHHLRDDLAALDWTMDSQDVERLRAEFPGQMNESNACKLE